MTSAAWMVFFLLQMPPAAPNLQATVTVDKPSFVLGENVELNFCIRNTSNKPVLAEVSFSTFKVTAKDARGVDQPQPKPMGSGEELMSPVIIEVGKTFCSPLALRDYLDIQNAGTFNVSVMFHSSPNTFFVLSADGKSVTLDPQLLSQCEKCAALPTPTKEALANSVAPGPIEAHTAVTLISPGQ